MLIIYKTQLSPTHKIEIQVLTYRVIHNDIQILRASDIKNQDMLDNIKKNTLFDSPIHFQKLHIISSICLKMLKVCNCTEDCGSESFSKYSLPA